MGIFNFLKGFFEEPAEPEKVNFDELDNWIDAKIKTSLKDAKEHISSLKEQIDDEKQKLIDNLKSLENAEYSKKTNLPLRVIHTVDGNRKIYRQKTTVFVNNIEVPENISKINDFCTDFFEQLEDFAQNTSRNVQIISEIFGLEMSKISINIKQIDVLIKEIKTTFDNSSINRMNKIKSYIKHIEDQISFKSKFKDKMSSLKDDLTHYQDKIKTTENNIKKLNESKEHTDLIENKQKVTPLMESKKSLIVPFDHNFSVINTTLRKYEHISLDNKLLTKYIENPLDAIQKDNSLEITELVLKIKDTIRSEKLKLQDNKKHKILHILDELDKDYFTSFLKKYNSYDTELAELNDKINKSNILNEIQDEKKQLEHHIHDLKDKKEELEKQQHDYDNIDIEELRTKLKTKINENEHFNIKLI